MQGLRLVSLQYLLVRTGGPLVSSRACRDIQTFANPLGRWQFPEWRLQVTEQCSSATRNCDGSLTAACCVRTDPRRGSGALRHPTSSHHRDGVLWSGGPSGSPLSPCTSLPV